MPGRSAIVVSYHFPPSLSPGSLRMTSLVRRMVRDGWEVHVITARRAAEQHADADSAGYIPDGVSVERTGSFELYRRIHAGLRGTAGSPPLRWLRRLAVLPLLPLYPFSRFPDKQVGWTLPLLMALRRALRARPGAVVLSSSPPHSSQLSVALLRLWLRFRWVADFRDPWSAPVRQPRGRANAWLQRRLERLTLGRADAVIANTPGNRRALLAAFPKLDANNVVVVSNGYDAELAPVQAARDPEGGDIVYVGEVYPGMLDLYLSAVRIIAERGGPVPVLDVYGIFDERERAAVRRARLENAVRHRGVVGWRRSLEIMRGARSLLLLLEHHERWRSCVPSKLYPYLDAGRPVLALVPDGDASAIVLHTGAGVAVTSSRPAEVAAAMEAFLAAPDSVARRDPDAVGQYDMEILSEKIQRVLAGEGTRG